MTTLSTSADPAHRNLVAMGECMALFLAIDGRPLERSDTFRADIAGAEANVAVGVARLGFNSTFIGRVGDDATGRRVVRSLRGEGINTDHVHVDPYRRTGVLIRDCMVGQPVEVIYHRAGSAGSAIEPADLAAVELDATSVLHLTGITPMLSSTANNAVRTALTRARQVGATTSFDVNFRSKLGGIDEWAATIRPLLAEVDLLFLSEDEAAVVSETNGTASMQALGPKVVVMKHGADGVSAVHQSCHVRRPAQVVRVVDPVGAGDAFAAGFLAEVLKRPTLAEVDLATGLEQGVAAASLVLQHQGDLDGLPRAETLLAVRNQDHEARR